ncbi:MAG TPA: HlyD family secretion protein [Caulobacteraceae bacterium]|nr:HlyD family secretion protein [Caulobacteraceae bacterium]
MGAAPTSPAQPPRPRSKPARLRRWLAPEVVWRAAVFVIALVLLIVILTRWNVWQGGPGWRSTDNAYLQSDLTPIAAKVPGYVREVPVGDFERVRAGQLVVQLADDDYRANVAQDEANVAAAKAQLETLQAQRIVQDANVSAAQAVAASTAAQLAQNVRDLARQKQLYATGSSTTEAAEKLITTGAQLRAQLQQNQAQATAAQRQLKVLAAQIAQAAAAVDAQTATLRLAQINLGYTRIVAPSDGVLSLRQVRPGQFVGVGGQVTTVTALPNVWVIANFKETQISHMAVGDQARITVDSFPGHTLRGHLQAFAPGSGAQFALLPPDNATGNFTKVVQRIPIKIAIDNADGLADRLRPGMSVIASVDAQDGRR